MASHRVSSAERGSLRRMKNRPEVLSTALFSELWPLCRDSFFARVRKYMFMECGHEAESEGEGHHERYSRLFEE